jgi:hypothetical protein
MDEDFSHTPTIQSLKEEEEFEIGGDKNNTL